MAWTTNDGGHESNTLNQLGRLGGPVPGLYETPTDQNLPLGYRIADDSGRVFRWAHFVSDVGPGKVAALDASVAVQTSIDAKFTDSAGTAKDDYGTGDGKDTVIYATDSGSFTSDDAADTWAGGFMQITDAAGEGYNYRVQSNTAGAEGGLGANTIGFSLYDNLASALDSESSFSLVGNPYKNLAIATTTDAHIVGVTAGNPAAADYGWVQTWGVCNCLVDGATTTAVGTIMTLSDDDSGGVQTLGGASFNSEDDIALSLATEPFVGYFMDAVADTEYGAVYLQITP